MPVKPEMVFKSKKDSPPSTYVTNISGVGGIYNKLEKKIEC